MTYGHLKCVCVYMYIQHFLFLLLLILDSFPHKCGGGLFHFNLFKYLCCSSVRAYMSKILSDTMFSDGAHVYVCNAQFSRNISAITHRVEKCVQQKRESNENNNNNTNNKEPNT